MATFYIEAIESTTLKLSKIGTPTVGVCKYGIDDNTVPNSYSYGGSISLTAGQKCYFTITATTTAFTTLKYLRFTSTGMINVGGNLSDLIGGTDSIPRDYCFFRLFQNCTTLVDASNLVLCNNFNSKLNCYYQMFQGCSSLIAVPQLTATELAEGCYTYMFYGCSSLTSAPQLPATTLASKCYQFMFHSCSSLVNPPQLPVTSLVDRCYYGMFSVCTSLTTIPELPATALPSLCYGFMFNECSSLKLSETQTGNYRIPCRIPSSGTGSAETNSLNSMFVNTGGTFTGTPTINTTYYIENSITATFYIEAVENTTITLFEVGFPTVGTCNYGIDDNTVPNEYTYDTDINLTAGQKCYFVIEATTTDFADYGHIRFDSTGMINVGGNLSDLIGQTDSIPRNYCFVSLFYGCTNLVDASNLVLCSNHNNKTHCYRNMFFGCTSLVSLPSSFPSTTLTEGCYQSMFNGCTALTETPELPSTELAVDCYEDMFNTCRSLTTPPELPATVLRDMCYARMFYGTSIKISATQVSNYITPYRVPTSGIGTDATFPMMQMFANTGGTLSAPTINTTCYVWVDRGKEVACLINPLGSGEVTGTGYYEENESVTLTATPSSDYRFTSWELNGSVVSTDSSYTFTMGTEPLQFTANFEYLYANISVNASPSSRGSVSGGGLLLKGSQTTITATPNLGNKFVGWYLNSTLVSTNETYTFTVTEDATYTGNFTSADWIPCVLDRTVDDVRNKTAKGYMNLADWNRIETDCLLMANTLSLTITTKRWVISDIPRTEDLTRIRSNVLTIIQWCLPNYELPLVTTDFTFFNAIEKALQTAHDRVYNASLSQPQCNYYNANEPNVLVAERN